MNKLHVLPTDKPSRLYIGDNLNFVFGMIQTSIQSRNDYFTNQHIYITSDEEIKEGDWYINTFVSEKEQKPQTHTEKRHLINHQKDYRFKYCKKIILTTDQDLIKDGVQAIDDEFLEWFVKNPSCEEVGIEKFHGIKTSIAEISAVSGNDDYNWKGIGDFRDYKIIIPKEEPKQEGYICPHTKLQCDDECCVSVEDCHIEASIGVLSEPKQETLEEVAEKYVDSFEYGIAHPRRVCKNAFINGAKWQQERSYSEEEVLNMINDYDASQILFNEKYTYNEWFEQYKKK